jgi:hypothetical protein
MKAIYAMLTAVCCLSPLQELKAGGISGSTPQETTESKLLNLKNFTNDIMPGWKFLEAKPQIWRFLNVENPNIKCTISFADVDENSEFNLDNLAENIQKYMADRSHEEARNSLDPFLYEREGAWFPYKAYEKQKVDLSNLWINGFEIKKVKFSFQLPTLNTYCLSGQGNDAKISDLTFIYKDMIYVDYLFEIGGYGRFIIGFEGPKEVLNETNFDQSVKDWLSH